METDYAIIGGGVVGLSVAWGLLQRGLTVTVLDGDDGSFRASRGNFGLVWVQSKGMNQPRYAQWSPTIGRGLGRVCRGAGRATPGMTVPWSKRVATICISPKKRWPTTVEKYETLKDQLGGDYPFEVLGHNALRKRRAGYRRQGWSARSCIIRTATQIR